MFTINGFPHGTFHGQPVKADVHAPDWRTEERVQYTLRLAEILDALLPDGVDGTISTSPLSYAPWVDDDGVEACTRNVRRVSDELGGTRIALAIEPEADGALATVDDVIRWWPDGLENVTVCFDACHSAVAYEEPEEALDALDEAGIRVGKAQLSAALTVPAEAHQQLQAFADPIYLHQVTERRGRTGRGPTCRRRWPTTGAARSGACTSTCRSSSSATGSCSRRRTISSGASGGCARRISRSRPTPGTSCRLS